MTGYVLGIGLGMFMGAMGDVSPIQVLHGREVPQAPLREQARAGFKSLANKSISWGKNFAVLTALFGGVECVIEKYRYIFCRGFRFSQLDKHVFISI